MTAPFATPQAAEDAFYDALEERDAALMMEVWDDAPEIACLLPMQPLVRGEDVRRMLRALLQGEVPVDIEVRHIQWVEAGEIAIHYLAEVSRRADERGPPPPVYATNVFRRRGPADWRLILHQNSPPPPPRQESY
jgi:hypothetical protein